MVYYEYLDPLYHETKFSNELLKMHDYVKQALCAMKSAETHISWKNPGVEWRGHHIKLPKGRNEYEFWTQKVHSSINEADPMFSDVPDEKCLDISPAFLFNFLGPLRMNMHRRFKADSNTYQVGWIIEPTELIAWTTAKFIHHLDAKVQIVVGKVQWQEIIGSKGQFGYGDIYGELNEFVYDRVKSYVAENNIDLDKVDLHNCVEYDAQDPAPSEEE